MGGGGGGGGGRERDMGNRESRLGESEIEWQREAVKKVTEREKQMEREAQRERQIEEE